MTGHGMIIGITTCVVYGTVQNLVMFEIQTPNLNVINIFRFLGTELLEYLVQALQMMFLDEIVESESKK